MKNTAPWHGIPLYSELEAIQVFAELGGDEGFLVATELLTGLESPVPLLLMPCGNWRVRVLSVPLWA